MEIVRKVYLSFITSLLLLLVGITACREVVLPWNQESSIKDSIAGDYLSARFAQKINDNEKAIKYFKSALSKDPNSKDLLKKGYEIMLLAGKVKEASALARRFIDQGGTSPDARLLVALDEVKKQKFAEAEAALDRVEVKSIDDVGTASELVIPLFKIWLIAGGGDYKRAVSQLQERRKGANLESFIRYQMALLYDLAGNSKEAEELFDDLSEGATKSLRLTEVTTNFYMRQGKEEKAKTIIGKFIEQNPGLSPDTFLYGKTPVIQNASQGASELLLEVASFLYSNRLDDMAQGYTYMSLYLTPDFPHAKLLLSKLLRGQKRFEESIAVLKTITYPPYFHWQARLQTARIYYKMGQNEDAEKLLLLMAKQDPNDKDALLTLGDVLMDREEYERAVEIYSQALDRTEKIVKRDWIVYYARGIAYERAELWDKAEKDFFKALELKPNQPEVLNYLGYSWLMMNKNIEDAKEMLKTAITLRPTDAHIIDSYGWALFKIEDYEGAVRYLEKANLLLPQDITTNEHLGDVYWKLGRINEAYFQWKRALSFDPEEEDRVKIQAKLEYGLEVPPVASADQGEEIIIDLDN